MISMLITSRMKFCGLQLHMVLVLAVICIIMYVFYISKDISHLEKELRILRHDVDTQTMKMKQMVRQSKPSFVTAQVVVPPAAFMDDEVSIGSKVLPIDVDIIAPQQPPSGQGSEEEEDVVVAAEVEIEEIEEKEDIKSLSWSELKERCKQRNIPIKGCTKEQLIAKLAE